MIIAWFILLISTFILLAAPFKRTYFIVFIRRSLIAVLVAVSGIFFFNKITSRFLQKNMPETKITIIALNEKNEKAQSYDIVVKGVVVDDKWYWVKDLIHSDSGWIDYEEGAYYWSPYSKSNEMKDSLELTIPGGRNRVVVFENNKWSGKAKITSNNSPDLEIDTYSESDSIDYGVSLYSIENFRLNKMRKILTIIFGGILFLIIQLLFLIKKNTKIPNQVKQRTVWMDVLRVICIFTVIFLHYTTSLYEKTFNGNIFNWLPYLCINCLTSFAVPCFFMLSGALILHKQESISYLLKKRIPSVYIPLILWSIIYIIILGPIQGTCKTAIIKSLYSSQYYHLWFMYPLLGLYFLSPVVRQIFINSEKSLKQYAYILMCLIPTVFLTVARLFRANYISLWFAWGFPEIGLFVLGAWLINKEIKLWKCVIGAIVSLICIMLGELTYVFFADTPSKNFIGAYGTLPVFIFAVFIFAVFISSGKYFERFSDKLKQRIATISNLSMGVYFIHLLVKEILDKTNIYQSNSNSIIMMLFAAIVNFAFSFAICFAFSQIPIVGRLFGKTNYIVCNVDDMTRQMNGGGATVAC